MASWPVPDSTHPCDHVRIETTWSPWNRRVVSHVSPFMCRGLITWGEFVYIILKSHNKLQLRKSRWAFCINVLSCFMHGWIRYIMSGIDIYRDPRWSVWWPFLSARWLMKMHWKAILIQTCHVTVNVLHHNFESNISFVSLQLFAIICWKLLSWRV